MVMMTYVYRKRIGPNMCIMLIKTCTSKTMYIKQIIIYIMEDMVKGSQAIHAHTTLSFYLKRNILSLSAKFFTLYRNPRHSYLLHTSTLHKQSYIFYCFFPHPMTFSPPILKRLRWKATSDRDFQQEVYALWK